MLIHRFLVAAGLVVALSAFGFVRSFQGGEPLAVVPQIVSINLSGSQTYPNGSPANTPIGDISVTMDIDGFTGTLGLQDGGVDDDGTPCDPATSSHFKIVGVSLQLAATLSGTFSPCITATQGPSSMVTAFVITGTSASQIISSVSLISGGTFPGGSGSGTVAAGLGVTMSPSAPPFTGGSLAMIGTGVDNAGTACPSSGPTNFHLSSTTTLPSNIVLSTTLVAGSYTTCVKAVEGASSFTQAFTLVATSSGNVFSMTVKNIAGSTTPTISGTTMVPVHLGVMLPPGAVPEPGNVLVASVGGTPLANAQIDSQQCAFWDTDGSLRFCPWSGFVPQMAGGAKTPIEFTVTGGSWPTASAVTPATIAAASDFKVILSRANTSFVAQRPSNTAVWYGVSPGFYVTAGAISGGVIRNPPGVGAGTGGLLGWNCNTSGANCITPANYQDATRSIATPLGSSTLTYASVLPVPALGGNGIPGQITIIDVTNPSAIPDNTTVLSVNGSTHTIAMSTAAAAAIPATDVLAFGYTIRGGTSNGAFTLNVNGSSVPISVNIIKPGAGFAAIGSGAMTASINSILNAYGSTDPPACSARGGAATFTESFSAPTMTTSGVTGTISIGQLVSDGTNSAIVTGGSGSSWTIQGTLLAGPTAASATPKLCWYSSSPTRKAYEGFGEYHDNVSGAPDPWNRFRFTIEAWIGPTGLYAIKPTITTDNSIFKAHANIPNYTYDADIKNGAAQVFGAADGGAGNVWAGIIQGDNASWTTLDRCTACATGASGRPVWLPTTSGTYSATNSQALAQIIVAPSAADLAFIHASHAAPPLDNSIVPLPSVLTTSTGYWGGLQYPNLYAPYQHGGTDSVQGFNSGGDSHPGLGPMGQLWAFWYLATVNHAADDGASTLQAMRVAANALPGIVEGPRYDDVNLPVNEYNASVWSTPPSAFTDAPQWDIMIQAVGASPLYINQMTQGLTSAQSYNVASEDAYGTTDHYPELSRAEYLIEAERYTLQNWIDEAEMVQGGQLSNRSFTLSSGARYDVQILSDVSHRQNAWSANVIGPLAYLGPPDEPAIKYFKHVVADNYALAYAWYSFIGTGRMWSLQNDLAGVTFSKSFDISANGEPSMEVEHEAASAARASQSEFMDGYWAMQTADMSMLDNCADTNLCGFAHNDLDNYFVKNPAVNSCAYNDVAYVIQWANDAGTQSPQSGWDATTQSAPQRGNGPVSQGYSTVHVENGSTIITAALSTIASNGVTFQPTATSAVAPGQTTIPLSSITAANGNKIGTGWVIKDLTNPAALTYPTYVTGAATGLTIPISPAVPAGVGIALGDKIVTSAQWRWDYPVGSGIRMPTDTRAKIANVDWTKETSPSAWMDNGVTSVAVTAPWPPTSTPQVTDTPTAPFGYLCMDASGAAIAQYSTTPCASPTYVTWNTTMDFSMAYVPNASCPASGDWRLPSDSFDFSLLWASSRWRKALVGVLGASADATTAISNISPNILPANSTFHQSDTQWGGDDHF